MPSTPKQQKLGISKEKPASKTLEAKSDQRVFSQPLSKTPAGKKIPPNMMLAGGIIIVLVLAIAGYYYFLQYPITPTPPTPPPTPPPSSLAWFSIEPVQCQGNAWDEWAASQGATYANVKATPEFFVREYLSKVHSIQVIEFQDEVTQGVVCQSCSCPTGHTYSIRTDASNRAKLLSLGWVDGLPTIEPGKTVEVSTASDSYVTNQGVGVQVKNNLSEPLFLPGCNAFVFEQANGTDWGLIVPKQCLVEGTAVKVPSTGTFNSDTESIQSIGTYRVSVDYSLGCTEGKPLSQAGCRETKNVDSTRFDVRKAPALFNEELVIVKAASLNLSIALKNLFLDVYNNSDQNLYFGTCNAFYVQAKDADGVWSDTTNNYKCATEGIAKKALAGQKTTQAIRITRLGNVRLDFRYGVYCEDGKPLPEANCQYSGHSYTFYND